MKNRIPKSGRWQLVTTKSRGKTFYGYSQFDSPAITILGESRRQALQQIRCLQHGEAFEPLHTAPPSVVHGILDVAEDEALTADDVDDMDA